jgi:hypothetical protein
LFELFFLVPKLIFVVFLFLLGALLGSIGLIMGKGLKTPSSIMLFALSPLLFLSSVYFFVLFIETPLVRHILAFGSSLLIAFSLRELLLYIRYHHRYIPFSLENISGYLHILSLFFFGAATFAGKVFLDIPLTIILPVVYAFSFFMYFEMTWVNKFLFKETKQYVLINAFLASELFLALAFLPLHFLILGALFAILGYLLLEFSRAHLLGVLSRPFITRRLVLAGLLISVLLATAKWTI